MNANLKVGKLYICDLPGSWLHGKVCILTSDTCQGPETDFGHYIWVVNEGMSHVDESVLLPFPGLPDALEVIGRLRGLPA